MSAIEHLPSRVETFDDTSLQKIISEEMFAVLRAYGIDVHQQIGQATIATVQVTERYDVPTDDGKPAHAYRVRSVPGMEISSQENEFATASDRYVVMCLEYGYLNSEDDDCPDDDQFLWRPYVVSIVDGHDINEPGLFNAMNGKELDDGDNIHIFGILLHLREYLREASYESEIGDSENPLVSSVVTDRAGHGDYVARYLPSCDNCIETKTLCAHLNPETFN